jgi:hypothetical protein
MQIVLYTSQVAYLTGGEINIRDWAFGLKSRGHKVIVYTPLPGLLAQQIRDAGIAVADDPANIAEAPDILFGSGIHEIATLIARFPAVPAIQVSQQWDAWSTYPSPLPQVVFNVSVDEINAEMLVNEFGIPRERVRIIHNAVDLVRIPVRTRQLPKKPERALVFVKANTSYIEALDEVLKARGIVADHIGSVVGRSVPDPLKLLVDYDLVVGAARTAIEGAACGAAVLVADHRGLAGMLTTMNFELFRANNFGRAVLTRPVDAETIGAELGAYDAVDASTVSQRVRASASLDRQLERLEALFAEAIQRFKQRPLDPECARAALASYVARHLPRHGEPSPRLTRISVGPFINEQIDTLKAHIGVLQIQSEALRARIEPYHRELVLLRWLAWPIVWASRRAKSILRGLPKR